jgi:hypothetical protein
MYRTITDVRAANERAGRQFFCSENMKLFDTRFETPVLAGEWFVTSETTPVDSRRRYTVRYAKSNGDVDIAGGFRQFYSLDKALRYLEEECEVDTGALGRRIVRFSPPPPQP